MSAHGKESSGDVSVFTLIESIQWINSSYGRGSIVSINIAFYSNAKIEGTVSIKKQYGEEEPRFRVVDGTLIFRGHKVKV